MLLDLQVVKPNERGLYTDLVTSSRRRLFNRLREVTARGQQARVLDETGRILSTDETKNLER